VNVSTKEYFLPGSADEAAELLAEHGPSLLVLAGGTIAMPLINEGVSFPERVMGLKRAGLNQIQQSDGQLKIGACATHSQLAAWEGIPALQEAAHSVGGWAIRNMGTAGGNLFAPPPAGDLAVMLLALDANVKIVRRGGERVVSLNDFYTGFLATALEPGELVTEFQCPLPAGKVAFLKHGRKQANTPSIVTVAVNIVFDGDAVQDARIALGAVGPHPFRSEKAEAALIGSRLDTEAIDLAAAAAAEECDPIPDSIASGWYRRQMTSVMVGRTLAQISN
jgi:CO/xanthine dehydrogenase FAD-binding subunit